MRAGGKVCNYNGIRVMGLLAMTRAFGDHCLSNFGIIAEPEVCRAIFKLTGLFVSPTM